MKEKIEQRVIGLFVLMVAILVFIAASAVTTISGAIRSSDWVNKTHAVILEVNAVLSYLHAGDAALRTYLLTGDSRDQQAYRLAYSEMVNHLHVAKRLTENGVEKGLQNPQIMELESLIADRVNFTRSVVQARQGPGGLDAARQLMAAHPDVESMGKIQHLVQNMTDAENSLLKDRDRDSHLKAQEMRFTIYTGVAVNFILLFFVVWLMKDDLAARRHASRILQDANATLETKVQERTAELSKSNQSLKQENLERRWSNQALDHQLRYSQLIINSIGELVFVISRALNISRINPAVSQHGQWQPQDLIAQPLDLALRVQPQGVGDAAQNPIAFAMRQGREIQDTEAVLLTKSGGTIPVRYSMFPLRDQDKVVGAVVTVRVRNGAPRAA